MLQFTRYAVIPEYRTPVPMRRMFSIFMGGALILAFGLGQLHLQFGLNNIQRETTKLQDRKMALRSRLNLLRSEVESRKKGDRLLQYAEAELGMVRYPPSEWQTMAVASDIQDRYREAQLVLAMKAHRSPASLEGLGKEKQVAWLDSLVSQLSGDSVFAAGLNAGGGEKQVRE